MRWIDYGVYLLLALCAGLTVLVLFLVWRDGYIRGWRAARMVLPTCLACGYNLSGLSRCQCPECGREYRLEQLWRAWILPWSARETMNVDMQGPGRPTA